MKKILFVLIGVLVSHICFAQSSLVVIYDNTYNDKLTTFQISNGEFVGDEIIMDTDTRPPYNINYFSFTYWEQNFNGNEQMKVLFYENNGTDGQPSTVLWDSGLFDLLKPDNQVPDTTYKYQVIFDENSGISANVGQQNFTWAVTLSGLDTGESAGLWIYSPPTVGKNYDDYWYKPNDTSPWQLRRGAQPGAQPIDFEATVKASDLLPTDVNVTAPAGGAYVVAGSSVNLVATATDPDGWIQKMEFYVNGSKVGEDTSGPTFSVSWDAGSPDDVSITAKAYDNLNQSTESPASTVHIVANTAPSFTKGLDIIVSEDAGLQTKSSWATAISPGPDYESGQTLTFLVSNDNNALFSQQPSISSDGTLTFQSAPDANGSAIVTVALQDDGGTLGDGDDTSDEQNFTITVTPVNDAPVAQNVFANVQEDTQTDIELVGSDIDGDTLTFNLISGPLHGTVNSIVGNGNIATYTPNLDYNGVDSFTYKAYDGALYSDPATVSITVTAVNDVKPSYFSPATNYLTEAQPIAVVIGDFIKDGRKDIAVACADSRSIVLFKGKGAGKFDQVDNIRIINDCTPVAMVAADFNLDNRVDLAVAVQEEKIIFLYNTDNQGGFSQSELSLGFIPIGLQTDRFDADALPDLATLSVGPNTLHIIHKIGSSIVPLIEHFNVGGGQLVALASGDYNRDARKDVAILDKGDQKVRIMKQLLDRTFTPATPSSIDVDECVPSAICFADFNGDRYDDIAVGNGDYVSIFLSQANGTLVLNQTINLGFESSSIAAADLDRDTVKDLIVSTANPTDQLLFVLKGVSGGTFNYYPGDPNITFAIGEGQHAIAVDDVSSDANLDAVVANSESSNISVLLNNRIPKVYAATYITLEDNPVEITLRGSYGPLDYTIPGLPIYGSLELKPGYSMNQATISPVFTFTPTPDFYGNDYFYFYASDGVKQSTTARISIRVKSVNDKPSFEIAQDNITVNEDSLTKQIDNFIINLNKGAVNESYQGIRYIVSNDNIGMFLRQPSINSLGSLIFMPKKNAFGSAEVRVYAKDSGGILDGGIDTSETKTFTIVVNNINDPPVISRLVGSTVINKNTTGAFQVYISDIDNDVNSLILTATSSDQSIIANSNIVVSSAGPVRDVQFTPVQDAKGRVLLTFTVSDGMSSASKSIYVTVR